MFLLSFRSYLNIFANSPLSDIPFANFFLVCGLLSHSPHSVLCRAKVTVLMKPTLAIIFFIACSLRFHLKSYHQTRGPVLRFSPTLFSRSPVILHFTKSPILSSFLWRAWGLCLGSLCLRVDVHLRQQRWLKRLLCCLACAPLSDVSRLFVGLRWALLCPLIPPSVSALLQ